MLDLILQVDNIISNTFLQARSETISKIFLLITNICNPITIILLTILCFVLLAIFKNKKELKIFIPIGLAFLEGVIIKNIIKRPRQLNPYYLETGYSFPSLHSIMAVVFYGMMTFLLLKNIKNKIIKGIIIAIYILIATLVAFSRIYLGVHYFSDVICGIIIGGINLIFGCIFLENKK